VDWAQFERDSRTAMRAARRGDTNALYEFNIRQHQQQGQYGHSQQSLQQVRGGSRGSSRGEGEGRRDYEEEEQQGEDYRYASESDERYAERGGEFYEEEVEEDV
jgi:hypothetical protein